MKKLLMSLVLLNTGCALASPPITKFAVHVTDVATGIPITNAAIHTGFTQKYDPWGLGVGESTRINEQVDTDGIATFEGNTLGDERGGSVFAEGYYPQIFSMKYKKNVVLNRWEPWDPIIEVKMRKIKNPVPMVQKRVESLKIPKWGEPLGFDLEKGDWIVPYGKGEHSDFYVNMHRRFKHSGDFDAVATITFPNEGDGIQLYTMPEEFQSSSYKFPYEAPISGYQNELVLERHATLEETKTSFDPKSDKYFFRVRTETDRDGKIISACYGRVNGRIEIGWGEVIDFSYHFNPDSHSRSLESLEKPY